MVLRKAYRASAVLAVLIGVAHTGAAFAGRAPPSQSTMWFAGAGLYLVLSGILGALDAAPRAQPGAHRTVARVNHWIVLGFGLVTGLLGRPSRAEWALVIAAFGGMAVGSVAVALAARGGTERPGQRPGV